MTMQQLVIVWIVGLVASGVLFYIGIGKPFLLDPMWAGVRATTPNYYVGALAPVLILGACAFASTLRKKEN